MHLEVVAPDAWAGAVASRWADRLAAAPALRQCLPTGATPVPAYRTIAAAVDRGEVGFARSTVFLLDEFGGLPAGHRARCAAVLRRELLDHVDLPPERFHRLDPDAADVDAECARFRAEVEDGGLDLVLLGLGGNGHLGLNEPGSTPTDPARRVALAEETRRAAERYGVGATPPAWGLTLGLAEILAAREVWLLVTGTAKAEVLRQAVTGPIGPQLPATFLRRHPACVVLADEPAASRLT